MSTAIILPKGENQSRNVPRGPFPWRRTCLYGAGILFSVWLLWPGLHPVHVEAFSARSQSLAIMDLRGQLSLDDEAYRVNIEYFYDLRLGTVAALSWIMRATHSTGDSNFHILTTGSFLLLLGACFSFTHRWSKSRVQAAFAFALLTPGLIEIAFFFSDNLPSAALAAASIALVSRRTPVWLWPGIGVLLAAALLCRSDGLLALPAVLVLSLLRTDLRLKPILLDWGALAFGAAALLMLSWHVTGVSLPHILEVSRWISDMHFSESRRLLLFHCSVTMFFGLPSILLLLAGAWSLWSRQSRRERLILTVYPILFYLYFMTKAIEPRNFLLLGAPFLILHGAAGVEFSLGILRHGNARAKFLLLAAAAVCALTFILPPRITISDGPRAILGRLWSPLLWRQWQSTIQEDMGRYNAFLLSVHPGERVLVVGVSFQAERYLHLQLLKAGYLLQPHNDRTPYGEIADTYVDGTKTILQIRNEQPFAIYTAAHPGMSFRYPQEFQLATELAALSPADYDRAVMMTWGDQYFFQEHVGRSPQFEREAGPLTETIPRKEIPAFRRNEYGKLRIIPLSQGDLTELKELALSEMFQEEREGLFPPLRSYPALQKALGCHFCTGTPSPRR